MGSFQLTVATTLGRTGFYNAYSAMRRILAGPLSAIFVYHRVNPEVPPYFSDAITPNEFEDQIKCLKKSGRIVPLTALMDKYYKQEPIPPKTFCITFDDGYEDNYTYAYPILQKYGSTATIFLTTGYIGNRDTFSSLRAAYALWNTPMSQVSLDSRGKIRLRSPRDRLAAIYRVGNEIRYMPETERKRFTDSLLSRLKTQCPPYVYDDLMLNWEKIKEMHRNGIEFGGHTVTHPILSQVSPTVARDEIVCSKKEIEQHLQQSCTVFAYTNGTPEDFDEETVQIVREAGFTAAVTAGPSLLGERIKDPFLVGRISAGANRYVFDANYSGFYPDMLSLRNRRHVESKGRSGQGRRHVK